MALTRIIYYQCNGKPTGEDLQDARHEAKWKHATIRIIWTQPFVGERHVDVTEDMTVETCMKLVDTMNVSGVLD